MAGLGPNLILHDRKTLGLEGRGHAGSHSKVRKLRNEETWKRQMSEVDGDVIAVVVVAAVVARWLWQAGSPDS